jgi:hypothetical protein
MSNEGPAVLYLAAYIHQASSLDWESFDLV